MPGVRVAEVFNFGLVGGRGSVRGRFGSASFAHLRPKMESSATAILRRQEGRMLNWIWFGLMAVAFIVAIFRGTAGAVTPGAIDAAKVAVEISIGLIGIMALWLGVMRIAEKAGLIQALSRALAPIFRWIFPDVPRDHPAMGAIVMNIAANMLGLNNAATPLGI